MDTNLDGRLITSRYQTSVLARCRRKPRLRSMLFAASLCALIAAQHTRAAGSYIQNNSVNSRSASTLTLTFSGAQTAGHLNIVFIGWNDETSYVTSMTDTSGNVYTFANQTIDPTIGQQQVWFTKNIAAAGAGKNTVTVIFNDAVPFVDLRIVEYGGIDAALPLDVVAGSSGNAILSTSGSATTRNADDTLVASNYVNHFSTGPGAGYTQRVIDGYGGIIEDDNVTSAGSYSATAPTLTPASWYIMQMLAVRDAGSPSGLPYPQSSILQGISWHESSKQRYASGSDLWDSMWASDGNIYGAWGDGTGFSCSGKRQLGISKLVGTPDSPPLTGSDTFCGAPNPPECSSGTPLGGKDNGVTALPNSVMYLFRGCPVQPPTPSWLAKSTNNGISWTTNVGGLQWPDANGFSFANVIQYGEALAGALAPDSTGTPYIYIYGGTSANPLHTYLARVAASPTNSIETYTNWSFFAGPDTSGNPIWSASSANAKPVFSDSNGFQFMVGTFDKAIGRYIIHADHGTECAGPCERQVGLFDGPSPWGPWTSFDYEEQFDNYYCGTNCLGNLPEVGWSMMQKWMSTDGLSIWVEYNATGAYDSLNLIKGTMTLAPGSTITSLSTITGTPAVLDHLSLSDPGNLEYIDRTYRLTSIPSAYIGKESIRLANNDKTSNASNYLAFTSITSQNVCVAWNLVNPLPSWLQSWTDTGNTLVGDATFTVYSKEFTGGSTVTLPGANARDVYLLFVGC
jgi:hypothetical protein